MTQGAHRGRQVRTSRPLREPTILNALKAVEASLSSEAEKAASRRRMLQSGLLFSALGVAAILGVDGVARALPSGSAGGSALKTSSASAGFATTLPGGPVTVEVVYFGMPLAVTSTKQELFVLESPAYFKDLLDDVVERHPIISAMIPTMIMSVNGVPGRPSTPMEDGDVVDLVPATAGG
jgi:molybdopterin converting factor small subunit